MSAKARILMGPSAGRPDSEYVHGSFDSLYSWNSELTVEAQIPDVKPGKGYVSLVRLNGQAYSGPLNRRWPLSITIYPQQARILLEALQHAVEECEKWECGE